MTRCKLSCVQTSMSSLCWGAPDTTANAACRTLLTTGIFTVRSWWQVSLWSLTEGLQTLHHGSMLSSSSPTTGSAAPGPSAQWLLLETASSSSTSIATGRTGRHGCWEAGCTAVGGRSCFGCSRGAVRRSEWCLGRVRQRPAGCEEQARVVSQAKLLQSKSSYTMLVKTQEDFCIIRGQQINMLQHFGARLANVWLLHGRLGRP